MNNKAEELAQILKAEVDLMTALAGVMAEKQQAIVRFQGDLLAACTEREEELTRPLEALEGERIKCATALTEMLRGGSGTPLKAPLPLRELIVRLNEDESGSLADLSDRMHKSVQHIVEMNGYNRTLLQHSLQFVQQTLRIITDNHRKQLVDERM